jgi:hypothetical protein
MFCYNHTVFVYLTHNYLVDQHFKDQIIPCHQLFTLLRA